MTVITAVQIAAQGWPTLVTPDARAAPVAVDRLATTPLWRLDASGNPYALRGWGHEQLQQAQLAEQFVKHVHAPMAVTVPVPLAVDRGGVGSFFLHAGCWWELAPWLAGTSGIESPANDAQVALACRTLARLHQRAASCPSEERGQSDGPIARNLGRLTELEREFANGLLAGGDGGQLAEVWRPSWPEPAEVLIRASQLTRQRLLPLQMATLRQQMIWGDAWHNNFLFSEALVVGMVDFATVRFDTPMADLARLLGSVGRPTDARWQTGLSAYAEVRPLDAPEGRALTVLYDSASVLSMANWLRWLAVEKRVFANQHVALARARHFAERVAILVGLAPKRPFAPR